MRRALGATGKELFNSTIRDEAGTRILTSSREGGGITGYLLAAKVSRMEVLNHLKIQERTPDLYINPLMFLKKSQHKLIDFEYI